MEQTTTNKMSKQQKWVTASTAAGFSLENMDIMFLSFSLASIIADLHISSGEAGMIGSITNIGMLVGGAIFGIIGDVMDGLRLFLILFLFLPLPLLLCILHMT